MICDCARFYKSGVSKKDGCRYKFEFVKKEDIQNNLKFVDSSSNLSKEEAKKRQKKYFNKIKWQQKGYTCLKCIKNLKLGCRYFDNKKCVQ